MMLRYSLNMEKEAANVELAVSKVLESGYRTLDISDKNTEKHKIIGTSDMGDMVADSL